MTPFFEELDYRPTPIGAISLRRRRYGGHDEVVYEIKLGDEFLMSSMFTASEIALAQLGLAKAHDGTGAILDVVVGGLGLGYTAAAVLEDDKVGSLIVVDALDAVIDWHRTGLVPLGSVVANDPRCRLVHGDFFALSASRDGFDQDLPRRLFDAILVDIDHAPDALLHASSADFYGVEGLAGVGRHLKSGGIFGLWSNDRPEAAFLGRLGQIFAEAWAEEVTFHNPWQDKPFTQTVYLARKS